MIKHDHPEMINAHEVILHPPPFRLLGGKLDKAGKCWMAEAYFETPRGPAHVVVKVDLPDAAQVLWKFAADKLILTKAAEKIAHSQGCGAFSPFDFQASGAFSPGDYSASGLWDYTSAGDDGAGFGFSFPNPLKVIHHAASKITRQVRSAANGVLDRMPAPLRAVTVGPLQMVAKATNAVGLQAAVAQAVNILGTTKIPGTSIPLAALNPAGAAVLYGSKIIGPAAVQNILGDEAQDLATSLMQSGALAPMGLKLAKAKANVQAQKLREDANFAREVGIPTLKVDPELRPAARQIINILRGAYIKEPKATAALVKLRDLAAKNDKNARMLWALAANISEAAWELHRGTARPRSFAAGDGLGEGYGRAGFVPPHNPALNANGVGFAGNGGRMDVTLWGG